MLELINSAFIWRTIVDVLLIATALFFIFRVIRRLGTWKILAGVMAAMAVFLAANILDLTGIQWIYSNLSSVIVIAGIIIFQPELRKVFERAVFFRHFSKSKPDKPMSEMIAESLFTMAQQRRGAIIVIPGRDSVKDDISGGFVLDAKPSVPLLLSIFDPNSPGHDGALIIEKGLFSQFGVRLPVSESATLPEEYGTRHHAAMGMAEKTDALVLVVSEERARVSMFHMGRMTRLLSSVDVKEAIESHWRRTSARPLELSDKGSRRVLAYQMGISFAIAVLFWSTIIVAEGELVERIVTVPVEYSATAPDLAVVGEREKEIQLYLGGSKSKLDALYSSNLSVKIDLANLKSGTHSIFITNDQIRLPKGVKLLEAIPSNMELTLAAIEEQWASISPQLVGELPAGIVLQSIQLSPDKVKVLSPSAESTENPLNITTTPVYLENMTKNTKILCKIIAPQTIQPADKRWPDVEVLIMVEKIPAKKSE